MEIVDLAVVSGELVVKKALEVLGMGGLVIYPTDTIYGVGVDVTSEFALDNLLRYKRQRDHKPISIAVSDIEMARKYVDLNEQAQSLYKTLLPGPFTIVSQSRGLIDKRCETINGTLGVRIPKYELTQKIIKNFGKAISATSANPSYKKQPRCINDVLDVVDDKQKDLIGLVIDAGMLDKRDPSTILDTTIGEVTVLRQGDQKYKNQEVFYSNNVLETIELGKTLMSRYKHYLGYKSVILALQGEMGVGKTRLTKGIGEELGVKQELKSPTFVLSQEYEIGAKEGSFVLSKQTKFYHMDLWRMRNEEELVGLKFLDLVEAGHVFAVEWADQALGLLKNMGHDAVIVWVDIMYGDNDNERKIIIRFD